MGDDDVTEIIPVNQNDIGDTKPICMVCLATFHSKERVPKSLTCGHSFCQECISQLVKNLAQEQRTLSCPTCRKPYVIEDRQNPLNSFHTNYALREMLEKHEFQDAAIQGNQYPCHDCRKELHEKDMQICNTCKPNGTSEDSLDFMGRPKVYLICSCCIQTRHHGHSYISREIIAGRWKHRDLFRKFEKCAEEEDARIHKLITTLRAATEATLKYRNNLHETVRQVRNNAGSIGISSILRSYVKAADDSSKFIDMSIESVERINNPNAPQYNMLGKKLFDFAKNRKVQPPTVYEQELSKLFNELNSRPLQAVRVSRPAETGSSSSIPTVSIASPRQENMNSTRGGIAERDRNNSSPTSSAITLNDVIFEPVPNPPVQQLTSEQLNNLMNYYLDLTAQQQLQYNQLTNFNSRVTWRNFDQARQHALFIATQCVLTPGFRTLQPLRRLQSFFTLPFHFLNVYYPQFYGETFGGMVQRFINDVPPNMRQEVHSYFFIEPFENGQFAHKRRISSVLSKIMRLIPEGIVFNILRNMKKDMDDMRHGERREERRSRDFNYPATIRRSISREALRAAPTNPDARNQPGRDLNNANFVEEVFRVWDRQELVQQPRRVDGTQAQRDNNVNVNPNELAQQRDEREENEDIILLNVNDEPNPDPSEVNQQEIEDREILQFQQQARENFVFQLEDLLIDPPARATRGAKRRADAIHSAENQSTQTSSGAPPSNASAPPSNVRKTRAPRIKRSRNA